MPGNSERVLDFWRSRWQSGRTGWHEEGGNAALREFWPGLAAGSRVLVPLCGKTPDLLWLAQQGHAVTGVELSGIAARAFFEETGLPCTTESKDAFTWYRCPEPRVAIACGDYFDFKDEPFDALFDRASLVALPRKKRAEYVRHTRGLLKDGAAQLLVTLEYAGADVEGPPFSVLPEEVKNHWPRLQRITAYDVLHGSPPRFREAGLSELAEAVWLSPTA